MRDQEIISFINTYNQTVTHLSNKIQTMDATILQLELKLGALLKIFELVPGFLFVHKKMFTKEYDHYFKKWEKQEKQKNANIILQVEKKIVIPKK